MSDNFSLSVRHDKLKEALNKSFDALSVDMNLARPFKAGTKYFDPGRASFMINYRVENLASLLDQLRKEGVEVDERLEEFEYGR